MKKSKRGVEGGERDGKKYREMRTLVQHLEIPTVFAALGASNAFQMWYALPDDKERLLAFLDDVIRTTNEEELRRYRDSVHHL